jgi:hypothetical protein
VTPDDGCERERVLLTRIFQFDIEEALARYEAESGLRVSAIAIQVNANGDCKLEIDAEPGQPHRMPSPPIPHGLVLNVARTGMV